MPQGMFDDIAVSPTQMRREEDLVQRVLRSFDGTPNPRTKAIMQAVTRHLHALVREVRLTEAEWETAVKFLTDAGHITDARRQEFILLSDVLGLSMQTIAINNQELENATEATVFGPFFVDNSPCIDLGGDISGGASGKAAYIEGSVVDTEGNPVPGARIEAWEADDTGLYDVQHADGGTYGRAHMFADEHGQFRFWGLYPTPYPIPDDGPVGRLLRAVDRSPYRAAHLHFMVTAPGWRTLVTHIFVANDPLLAADSVFGVKASLVKEWTHHEASETTPDGRDLHGRPWARTRFDIVLAPDASMR